MNFNIKRFHSILRQVALGGIIENCILQIDGKNGKVSGLDSTSAVFAQSEGKICVDSSCKETLSLREVGKLCKFVGDVKEENIEVEIKENRLCLISKSRGIVKFLLGEVEKEIEKHEKGIEEALKMIKNERILDKEKVEQILYFINLFGGEELRFRIKAGKVSIASLEDSIQVFSVFLGKETAKEDLELRFGAPFFKAIMNEVEWSGDESVIMRYEKESPLVFKQKKSFWILALIA